MARKTSVSTKQKSGGKRSHTRAATARRTKRSLLSRLKFW
jgi:hypothetical protein